MLKMQIVDYLRNQTAFFEPSLVSEIFTASNIATTFSIKRNTASHYLNQLNEEGILVKINTRPVYFFHKEAFQQQNYLLKRTVYQSFQEMIDEQPVFDRKSDFFQSVIGYRGSLAQTIEQLKIAALYPGGGLPVLITGESGTGKSFLASLYYQFCLSKELLDDSAPFVTVNCAQYANNPELLTSQLFGHLKGAFTGADSDKIGAFQSAEGGVLFLDEVHRLSPEGQEKLFTFLDQGIIYRMGETNRPIPVTCRLCFATTEEISSTFLTTFLRRIPIQIKIPSLAERTQAERKQLIMRAFYEEQQAIQKAVTITPQVIQLLENHHYVGNVGELRNNIKIITARSFAANLDKRVIPITLHDLPKEFLDQSIKLAPDENGLPIRLDEQTNLVSLLEETELAQRRIIQSYERILRLYVSHHHHLSTANNDISKEIERLFDDLLFEKKREKNHEMLLFITQNIRQLLETIESSYQIRFNGSLVYALSTYLFQRRCIDWFPEKEPTTVIDELLTEVQTKLATSYGYAEQLLTLVKRSLDIELSQMDRIIVTIYLHYSGSVKESHYPKAVIVAHGYATASSIANVANRLLNVPIFQSFDMPLDVTPKKISEHLIHYMERQETRNGLVILFDMGSLKEIYQYFPAEEEGPFLLMNNVTTSLALSIGEAIKDEVSFEELPQKALTVHPNEWEIILPENKTERVILTTCSTGIGTAVKIRDLLEKSLPAEAQLKIIPCEYNQLRNAESIKESFPEYEIVGIIGTNNPSSNDLPYISLEELIAGKGITTLLEWTKRELTKDMLSYVNHELIRNFSLDRVIQSVTILDTEKIIRQVEVFLIQLEERWQQTIQNDRKLAVYVHVSCLIERLIRNEPIENYNGAEQLKQCQRTVLQELKEAFSVIEKVYSVNIPESELFYVYDVLFGKTEFNNAESDF